MNINSDSTNLTDKLSSYISENDNYKSKHWKNYTRYFNMKNEKHNIKNNIKDFYIPKDSNFGVAGFGTISKKNILKKIYHFFFQRLLFLKKISIFYSDEYKIIKNICKIQQRNINLDVLRHVFTMRMINKKFKDDLIVCSIGDGRSNLVSPLLMQNNIKKTISINLPEILIADIELILKIIDEKYIKIADNEHDLNNFLKDDSVKLILIPSNKMEILNNKNIDLFVNIASFQEMKNETVNQYFDIIKKNQSYLYCCNRKYKKLVDGEILEFDKYAFENSKLIFKESCPWHNRYYSLNYPFFHSYDGEIIHSLVKF